MGKIIQRTSPSKTATTQTIVERQVDQFITDSTVNYAIFNKGAPTFVTYYSKMFYESDHDRQFEAYNESVGTESPIRYNRIENFPVWGMETSDFGSDESEIGYQGNVTTTFLILPNTITPNTDDQVEISISSKKYLFTVVSSESDNMNHSKYYKITAKLSHKTVENVQEQIDKKSEVDYGLLLEKRNAIKSKDHASTIRKLRTIYDGVLATYSDRFYNSKSMVFSNDLVLDQYLNHFITRNGLNQSFEKYRSNLLISKSINEYIKPNIYEGTIFDLLERDNLSIERLSKCKASAVPYIDDDRNKAYNFNFFLPSKYTFITYFYSLDQFDDEGLHIPLTESALEFDFDIFAWLEGIHWTEDTGLLKNQGSGISIGKRVQYELEWWMKDLSTKAEYEELLVNLRNYPESRIALEKLLLRLKYKSTDLIKNSIFTLNLKSFGDYSHSKIGNIAFIHEYIRFIRNGLLDEDLDNVISLLDKVNLPYYDLVDNDSFSNSDYYNGAILLYCLRNLYDFLTNA